MSVIVRAMKPSDLTECWELTQKLRWSHRIEDWQHALMLGEGTVAEVGGRVVGSILYWRWGGNTATLGFVIVDDAFQGRGIGKLLMLAALEALSDVKRIRLHATKMGEGMYARLGFVHVGSIHQYQTACLLAAPVVSGQNAVSLRTAVIEDIEWLEACDTDANDMVRPELIAGLLQEHRIEVAIKHGRLAGFAAQRKFGHGWVIGPVIAQDADVARLLVAELMSPLVGQFVRVDTGLSNELGDWLGLAGLKDVDAPVAMIKGEPLGISKRMTSYALMTQAMA